MATTTERNTPQPYAQGTYSTPNVGTPSHGLVQPGQQNGPERSTSGLQSNTESSDSSQSQAQFQSPSQSQKNVNTPTASAGSQPGRQGRDGSQKDTGGREQPAEEERGAAPPEPEGGYPEQLHAGKLTGLGPEYESPNHVKLSDRIQGIKEQVKGTIKRDPELKERGKERMTGELKRKEKEKEDNMDPFNTAADDKEDDDGSDEQKGDDTSQVTKKHKPDEPEDTKDKTLTGQTETGTTETPSSHLTDKGAQEQAGSVKPEGAGSNDIEARARSNAENAQVSSS